MRAYTIVSGAMFALLALAHVARLAVEGAAPLGSVIFVASTLAALAMAGWAVAALRLPGRGE